MVTINLVMMLSSRKSFQTTIKHHKYATSKCIKLKCNDADRYTAQISCAPMSKPVNMLIHIFPHSRIDPPYTVKIIRHTVAMYGG